MSTPSGQPSPTLRAAGVGLVALALVLGAVGVLSGRGDSSRASAEGSPTSTVTDAPSSSSSVTPSTAATPSPESPAAPSSPGDPATSSPTAPGPGSVDLGVPVRVLNNGTTTGLAADAATRLERSGWRDVSVGNYPQGIIPTSTVYYRAGTVEQAAAEQIAASFGTRVEQRSDGLADVSPGVVLIVTNDFPG